MYQLSFEYDDNNNEIEYTCEGGKSYITFNAILNTFDDTIEDPTKRNIIINAIIQIYLTYKMFNAEQNMDIRWKLPVKIKILEIANPIHVPKHIKHVNSLYKLLPPVPNFVKKFLNPSKIEP